MSLQDINTHLKNQTLKAEFAIRNMDLSAVWQPTPDNLELENHQLRHLLDWVERYQECPDRKKLEAMGYKLPPIDPDIDPDSDWLRFERWIQGKPIRKKLKDQLPHHFMPKNPDDLTNEEILLELEQLTRFLSEIHFSIDINENVPARLVYEHLFEVFEGEFDLVAEGWWHFDGCMGYCPGCFQRPWYEFGCSSC